MSTFERLKKIIIDQFGAAEEKITPEADIAADLNLDSLDNVELAIAIEMEFEIEISDEDIEASFTVGEVVKLVDGKVGAR